MIRLDPSSAPIAHLERLIGEGHPTQPRCHGVLDGALTGTIWVDSARIPRWVVVTELADGTTYIGGDIDRPTVARVFGELAPASGDIIVGLRSADDPIERCLPDAPYHDGMAIDFFDRHEKRDDARPAQPPAGLAVVDMDERLFRRTAWFADTLLAFGSIEAWRATGLGTCVLMGDEVVCEALTSPPARGMVELGIRTDPHHRGRGLGRLASLVLARRCEDGGLTVWWNSDAGNAPSIAIARRIGFTRERRYRLLAWRADTFTRR